MSVQRSEYTHREIQESLGAYALDALEPEAATIVERHLDGCVKCSIEVAQHHGVSGLLANSGGAPPAGLWDSIADQLNGSTPPSWNRLARRLGSDPDGIARTGTALGKRADGNATPDNADSEPTVIPMPSERPGRLALRVASIVAVAAAVAAIALGLQVNHLHGQVNASNTPSLLTQAEQAALHNPSTKQVRLTTSRNSNGSNSEGRVTVVLTTWGTGFVEAQGLSSLPRTETYQLWGVIGSQTISLGLLGPDPEVVPFSVAGDMPVEAFAITAEDSGGVVQSTNLPVVAGEVTA